MSQSQRQKSFEESLIAIESHIQRANTLASSLARESDGTYIKMKLSYSLIAELFLFQMRLPYSPIAQLFLFLVQWADCSLASSLGLIYITIYEVYSDGETPMYTDDRQASMRQFYTVIYPSLLQLEGGITEMEDYEQKLICKERYKKRVDEERRHLSKRDLEREKECGICMEIQTKVVLPNCSHAMCLNCYREWHARSESCPFCRGSLKRVNSTDLWILTSSEEVVDMERLGRENLRRLFNYIDNLPDTFPGIPLRLFLVYDSYNNCYVSPMYLSDRDPEDRGAFGM